MVAHLHAQNRVSRSRLTDSVLPTWAAGLLLSLVVVKSMQNMYGDVVATNNHICRNSPLLDIGIFWCAELCSARKIPQHLALTVWVEDAVLHSGRHLTHPDQGLRAIARSILTVLLGHVLPVGGQ
jgi:hypothetical protein